MRKFTILFFITIAFVFIFSCNLNITPPVSAESIITEVEYEEPYAKIYFSIENTGEENLSVMKVRFGVDTDNDSIFLNKTEWIPEISLRSGEEYSGSIEIFTGIPVDYDDVKVVEIHMENPPDADS